MVDKEYCMSSFLALRYIENDEKEFCEGIKHQRYKQIPLEQKYFINSAETADIAIRNQFHFVSNEKLGILLSGGMDSGVLASYMPKGADAYTFRFLGGDFQPDELERAEYFAKFNNLKLHYIDIDWQTVESTVDTLMRSKGAPVHSIEPQIYFAAKQAQNNGITMMVVGDGADYIFGGMDGLLSKDWTFDEYYKRSIYLDPAEILVNHGDIRYLFERYRIGKNSIDYIRFYNEVVTDESYASYENAFHTAGMPFIDPYEKLALSVPLDIERIRNGESKYIVRELFKMKYPIPVPQKLPMPRPVDIYFANWKGPVRPEFRKDIDITKYSGNQKWLMYCLERFLNMLDKR